MDADEREEHRKRAGARRRYLYRLTNLAQLARVRRMMAAADRAWADPPDPPTWSSDETGGLACCVECHREVARHDLVLDPSVLLPDEFCRWCARPLRDEPHYDPDAPGDFEKENPRPSDEV